MSEFGFINHIKTLCEGLTTNNYEGIGDDCAVLPIGQGRSMLFTADMLVERVHFLREATSPYDLGYKSLAVNLSDVASMGGQPTATLLSLSIPKELTGEWIEEFMRGYRDLSERFDVALVGGDTTASKSDLVVNVTAIGEMAADRVCRRSAAKVGDIIYVTNTLGASGAGLADILQGRFDTPNACIHKRPTPRVDEGVWLAQSGMVHAMMDISDGVASDLRHILTASEVGAEVELGNIPCAEGVSIETALTAGEDYELLFTAAPERAAELGHNYTSHFGTKITPIGQIVAHEGLMWLDGGEPTDRKLFGFTHY
ncbi:MAG: thiamine-phosphate kinase [Rikenellaceae bacterium]